MGDYPVPPIEIETTSSIIKKTVISLVEGMTGLAVSEKKEWILSAGHIFQGLLNGKFLCTLQQKWDELKTKGRIKDDYEKTEQHRTCLKEMLDFLDTNKPDDTTFTFMKKIFLSISTEDVSDRDSVLPQQVMSIARTLSSGEILVLSASYALLKDKEQIGGVNDTAKWLDYVAKKSGLIHPQLVEFHEQKLFDKKLLHTRFRSDGSGIDLGEYHRLTSLAYEICRFVESYDSIVATDDSVVR